MYNHSVIKHLKEDKKMTKTIKKLGALLLTAILCIALFGCDEEEAPKTEPEEEKREESMADYTDLSPSEVLDALLDTEKFSITIEDENIKEEFIFNGMKLYVTSSYSEEVYLDIENGKGYMNGGWIDNPNGKISKEEWEKSEKQVCLFSYIDNADILFNDDYYVLNENKYTMNQATFQETYLDSFYMTSDGTTYIFTVDRRVPGEDTDIPTIYTIKFTDQTITWPSDS